MVPIIMRIESALWEVGKTNSDNMGLGITQRHSCKALEKQGKSNSEEKIKVSKFKITPGNQ